MANWVDWFIGLTKRPISSFREGISFCLRSLVAPLRTGITLIETLSGIFLEGQTGGLLEDAVLVERSLPEVAGSKDATTAALVLRNIVELLTRLFGSLHTACRVNILIDFFADRIHNTAACASFRK